MRRINEFAANNQSAIFLILLLVMFFVYGLHKFYEYGPYGIHQYRQADCLSFAKIYAEDNVGFFEPGVLNLDNSGLGKTVSEFPILYFTYGKLWSVFGQHEWIARVLNMCILFAGLFSLHLLLKRLFTDSF